MRDWMVNTKVASVKGSLIDETDFAIKLETLDGYVWIPKKSIVDIEVKESRISAYWVEK